MAVGNVVFQVFQAFSSMLQAYGSSVSVVLDGVCFKCFIQMLQKLIGTLHMLQWLYTYVAYVLIYMFNMFYTCVVSVLSGCCIRL
jgi:hypothetical protein